MNFSPEDFTDEFTFKSSRSSGKGGQHVNKTESRISLFFNVFNSSILKEEQKQRLKLNSTIQISKEGVWQIDVEESRSQHKNKKIAIERFFKLLSTALVKPKVRKPSKPSKAAIKKRLKSKKMQSEKKMNRRMNY